ncbi:uncharacterized protein LOC110265795 isoform X1 [Arachis ipaensis]|uniref:uncharacterized protein LOC110265795 isoform X1 n=1 Tax=Arachis ipaensis TaxID=130454 RepID=UPI000A2B0AC7|nr:uncharacterized protein LOC110265795 isoform X1 [Arachis ipaensis]
MGRACRRVTAARRAAVVADEGGVRRVCHGAGEVRASEERRHRRRAVRRQLRCTSSSPSPSDRRGVVAVEPALRAAIEPQAESDAKRERDRTTRGERERRCCGGFCRRCSLRHRRRQSHELRIKLLQLWTVMVDALKESSLLG